MNIYFVATKDDQKHGDERGSQCVAIAGLRKDIGNHDPNKQPKPLPHQKI
jgi:hypothetical protein